LKALTMKEGKGAKDKKKELSCRVTIKRGGRDDGFGGKTKGRGSKKREKKSCSLSNVNRSYDETTGEMGATILDKSACTGGGGDHNCSKRYQKKAKWVSRKKGAGPAEGPLGSRAKRSSPTEGKGT